MRRRDNNIRAIALMTGGMAAGATGDAAVKALSGFMSSFQTAVVVGTGMAAIFSIATLRSGQRLLKMEYRHPAIILRTLFEVFGVLTLIAALAHVQLSTITMLAQSVPLLVTLGAVLWFREPATPRDWTILLLGFVGMLLIVQPGTISFSPAILLAVIAVILLSLRDLASRAVPTGVSTTQLGLLAGAALAATGLVGSFITGNPMPQLSPVPSVLAGLLVLSSAATFYGITAAMRIGTVAVVSPFRYSRILFGVGFGVVFFHERLDSITVIGAAIIIAAGLYTLKRQRMS